MGENTNRPARLLAALTTVAAAGALLTSCAGLARAGESAAPTEAAPVVVTSAPAPAESTTAPVTPSPTPTPSESAAKDAVEPFVTSAAWDGQGLDVGALVPKVVETGGTCTVTASRDGVSVEKSGAAAAASSYTGCPQLVLKDDRLVPGTWTVVVSYASDSSAGASAARTVTIG